MSLSADFARSLLAGFGDAYPHLLRVAQRSTGCRDAARDLVHDAWLRLAEQERGAAQPAAGEERAPRDAAAYLATLARHLALDHRRRDHLLADCLRDAAALRQAAPPQVPDAAEHLMYRQALAALEQALAGLPERARAAFVDHHVHGEPQADIARRRGVALNTIERDLMQARACIEDALHRWRGTVPGAARPAAGRRRSLAALLGVAGLGGAGLLAWRQWSVYRADAVQWQATLASGRGQLTRHTLPDGSVLQLDAESRADVRLLGGSRRVSLLEGAAFFAVARDEARPFVVQAGAVRITVLGTRFGVERVPLRDEVLVQVESGRVRVEPGAGEPARELGAGEALRVHAGGRAESESLHGDAAPWRQGEIVLAGATLGEALQRLARYAPRAATASAQAARLPVSGRIRIAQAGEWLAALPLALPVRLLRRADGGVHIESL
ncbi:sigma-70 family RNA polymerase sigma factor [Piscinibacter sp.]|uniref:sigma-70 family RNA polymerase sigma factor n=1 Tax=Piscinibacter sp. TaxID=1903157 RepID=UPI0039E67EA3